MTLEAMSVETLVPGGLNSAGQVMGEWPRPGPLGWGVGDGLVSHPRKKISLQKPDTLFKIAG